MSEPRVGFRDRFWNLLRLGAAGLALLVVVALIALGARSVMPVSESERARLDGLSAADVAATYISTTREPVRQYLSAPSWTRTRAGAIGDVEKLLGVQDVRASNESEYPVSRERRDWPAQRLLEVTWTSHWRSAIGEPPGDRMIFVLVGRQSENSPWKVLELGTMF